jgi:hypothetical protein
MHQPAFKTPVQRRFSGRVNPVFQAAECAPGVAKKQVIAE